MNENGFKSKIGVLGGGQLGKMILEAGNPWCLNLNFMDKKNSPCQKLTPNFTEGNITNYDEVLNFGKKMDVVTIEIENVNTKALKELEKSGVKVFPQPHLIEMVQDKVKQKKFFEENNFPTAEFILVKNQEDVKKNLGFLPAVQKLGKEGYDGKGVQKLVDENDLEKAFDKPGFLEKMVDFEREISVQLARNESGEIKVYPVVDQFMDPKYNLVDYLFCPSELPSKIQNEAQKLAVSIIEKMGMVGILAVEMFVTKKGKILINELAPRPHNSGHHTIEASQTSQFEQHLRAILNLPLGDTTILKPSAMINILGPENYEGEVIYNHQSINEILTLDKVYLHFYGKEETKPFRKMGHLTVLGKDKNEIGENVKKIKNTQIFSTPPSNN